MAMLVLGRVHLNETPPSSAGNLGCGCVFSPAQPQGFSVPEAQFFSIVTVHLAKTGCLGLFSVDEVLLVIGSTV